MDPPHIVLDALNDSISSGTFVDTKFYVFSRKDASGRVGSPRALYCNSRVLNTVPYFSTMFSEGFSEGRIRDINEEFPSDSVPHTESYDYLSDSDLEDGEIEPVRSARGSYRHQSNNSSRGVGRIPIISDIAAYARSALSSFHISPTSCGLEPTKSAHRLVGEYDIPTSEEEPQEVNGSNDSAKDDQLQPSRSRHDSDSHIPPTVASGNTQPPRGVRRAQDDHQPQRNFGRSGKVAIIRDMAAVTFEAMIYFLYTGHITFAPVSSDPRHELLGAEARTGNWNTTRLPCPSAKSIYRLADKYDMQTLKEQAKARIYDDLAHCNIVDEVFSGFSVSFPEIQMAQVSRLVSKMKEESRGGTGSATRRQVLEKIATLSPSRLARAADALFMIWNGVTGPLDLPTSEASPTFPAKIPTLPSRYRVKLALLKSISTGTLIDVQFYAYNAICNNFPADPRPLFTSSIVIEEWGPAITTQIVDVSSKAACPVDGLADDYECWDEELPQIPWKGKAVLKHQTEAATAESCEAVVLTSGAWKTWMSLLSFAYTNKMNFAPLLNHDNDPVADTELQRLCSPRSMYSLAAVLGIGNIKQDALKDIQSKLTTFNIAQELFTSFAASHEAIMDMEIDFFRRNLTEQDPRLFVDHVQKMASEESPFLPMTLSVVYDKLFEKVFPQPVAPILDSTSRIDSPSNSSVDPPSTPSTGPPSIPSVGSPSTSSVDPPSTSNVTSSPSQQVPAPTPEPDPPMAAIPIALLKCSRCGIRARREALSNGLYCPRCPPGIIRREGCYMRCPMCDTMRIARLDRCLGSTCQAGFI